MDEPFLIMNRVIMIEKKHRYGSAWLVSGF